MAIAPSIHVEVLLVQVALLLVTVIGHVILPRPRVRAREAALHLDERPVIREVLRPSEVHLNPEVRHQLALLPRDGLVRWCATWIVLVSSSASACAISSTSRSKSVLVSHQAPTVGPRTRPSIPKILSLSWNGVLSSPGTYESGFLAFFS